MPVSIGGFFAVMSVVVGIIHAVTVGICTVTENYVFKIPAIITFVKNRIAFFEFAGIIGHIDFSAFAVCEFQFIGCTVCILNTVVQFFHRIAVNINIPRLQTFGNKIRTQSDAVVPVFTGIFKGFGTNVCSLFGSLGFYA